MTDIEKKALALAIETRVDDRYRLCPDPTLTFGLWEALCRAIEQHEAFRQEVSDAVTGFDEYGTEAAWERLSRFIIAKPDPLVEAINSAPYLASAKETADHIRAALAARGLEVRKIGEDSHD